jgi:transposase
MSEFESRFNRKTTLEKILERRIKQVKKLRSEGMSFTAIALKLGIRESTIRYWAKQ